MTSPAFDFAQELKKNPAFLISLFQKHISQDYSIVNIEILKEKKIINEYKIVAKINTTKNDSFILEIYDNELYFLKNIFALKTFYNIQQGSTAKLFYIDKEKKIIVREFISGEMFIDELKKTTKPNKTKKTIAELAQWISKVHQIPINQVSSEVKKDINCHIESAILKKIEKFIKPNIEHLRKIIEKNLNFFLENQLNYKNKIQNCLIHGDFQPANILINKNQYKIIDFDTLQEGNPARDIGRFLMQLENLSNTQNIELQNIFLSNYLEAMHHLNNPQFTQSINYYKLEMLLYIVLGLIWEEKIPKQDIVEKIILSQNKLIQNL